MLIGKSLRVTQILPCRTPILSSSRTKSTVSKAKSVFKDTSSATVVVTGNGSVSGRANAGKSTLFNAVLGRKTLLHTSSKAGRTRELNFYRVGAEPGKLVLVDAPGYGARWETGRVYIVFNAKHGLNEIDSHMLQHLSTFLIARDGTQPFTLQSVITKVDLVPGDQLAKTIAGMKKEIFAAAPLCLPPILTSCEMKPLFGVDKVQKNIAQACGLA
ncbi:hypothetical protein DFP72DRAFT_903392 [Ephemerocybe angulata]|uniref:G domain-containing protein n=1 Tax=Ephemerocybe angulata TaxID=980116 RepID=A0A8H6M3F0_9AGAR|nr:hypothetical protein DFP72DRAFT_903392 [Tulosesus angulatus]